MKHINEFEDPRGYFKQYEDCAEYEGFDVIV